MRRAAVIGVATALVVIQANAAWAWGGRLIAQDPPPLAGETVTIGVVVDLGGKMGRDPSQLRVTNLCWPAGGTAIFSSQRSAVDWTSVIGTRAEGEVAFELVDPDWPVNPDTGRLVTADCEAYLWRVPNDTVSKGFPLTIYRVYDPPPEA